MSDNFFTLRHLNGEEEFDWNKVLLKKYECPTCDGYIPNNKTPSPPVCEERVDVSGLSVKVNL